MSHTYASEADLRAFFVDGDGLAATAPFRARLEAASRSVDLYLHRSRFGSGFGPRIARNRYTACDSERLWLDDDFVAITSVEVVLTTDSAPTVYAPETDYYLLPFDRLPSRAIARVDTSSMILGQSPRGVTAIGIAGYANDRQALAATIRACLAADTTLTPSAITEFSPGQTLWLDTEMVYVREVAASTITVDRGQNGTTAANHGTITSGTPITYTQVAASFVIYHPSAVEATLTLAARRWRRRDVNLPQAFADSGQGPVLDPSERTLLRGIVGNFRCVQTDHGLAEIAGVLG